MTAYMRNLPALIGALPSDHTRVRQVVFLENLSVTGSVRSTS